MSFFDFVRVCVRVVGDVWVVLFGKGIGVVVVVVVGDFEKWSVERGIDAVVVVVECVYSVGRFRERLVNENRLKGA